MSELAAQLASISSVAPAASSISVAKVVSNIDKSGLGRIQIQLRWNPRAALWARVAVPMAGPSSGSYFMPQQDDEVLVAFNESDVSEAYIIGCLWSAPRRPPKAAQTDPRNIRLIRTPAGHELLFDDENNLVSIVTSSKQSVILAKDRIELSSGDGKSTLALEANGKITIKATQSVNIEAPNVSVNGRSKLELKSSTSASLSGGGLCEVKAALVKIN